MIAREPAADRGRILVFRDIPLLGGPAAELRRYVRNEGHLSIYVFITRRPNPTWTSGDEIPESEWRRIALAESDFRTPTEKELAEERWLHSNDLAWTGHHQYPTIWFAWRGGQIGVKNPDQPILAKMVTLAARLNAQVISETGEFFDCTGASLGIRDLPKEDGQSDLDRLNAFLGARRQT
jgi:hypothetical protein